MPNPLAPGLDVEAVKLKIQQSIRNPHVGRVVSVTLKNGPRTYRIGTLYEIQRGDGTYHHSCLRIDSVDRTKAGWHSKPAKSVSLDSDGDDEIERLLTFIQSARSQELPKSSGEYRSSRSTRSAASATCYLRFAQLTVLGGSDCSRPFSRVLRNRRSRSTIGLNCSRRDQSRSFAVCQPLREW